MSIETMKLALEALESIGDEWGFTSKSTLPKRCEAITALRQAIEQAEQAQPVAVEFPRQAPQKEGGWRLDVSFIWRVLHTIAPDEPAEFIPSPEQIENTLLALERIPSKLYTATPPRPATELRKPLTDDEIKLVMDGRGEEGDDDYVKPAFDPFGISEDDLMNFARAIEAAHGITKE